MVFHCQNCGEPLEKSDINFQTGSARCPHCRSVSDFALELGLDDQNPPPPSSGRVADCAPTLPPENLKVTETDEVLRIERPWYTPAIYLLGLLSLFFLGGFVTWWIQHANLIRELGFFGVRDATGLLRLTGGLALIYLTLCGFFNRTVIEVSAKELTAQASPLPWNWGKLRLPLEDLRDLHWQEEAVGSEDYTLSHTLEARLWDGERHTIGHFDLHTVVYLGQLIEKRIKDAEED